MGLNVAQGALVPGKVPGYYMVTATGQVVFLGDKVDDVIYDSEVLPTVITAGQRFRFFVNPNFTTTGVAKLEGLHYKIPTWGQMPKDWEAVVTKIGFRVVSLTRPVPADDLWVIANGGWMQFLTGVNKPEAEGLLIHYPSPAGIGGSIAIDGNAVPVEISFGNIGTPAMGAVPDKKLPISLVEQLNYSCSVTFPAAITLRATPVKLLYCDLYVVRKKPV